MHHGVGVIHAHAVRAAVFQHQFHHRLVSILVRPVTLVFEQHLLPGHRHRAGLNHPLHRHVVGFLAGAAGGVGDDVHLVAFSQGFQCRESQADLGPQRSNDQLLATGGFHRVDQCLVFPGVHRSALDRLLIRVHRQQFGPDVTAEAFGFDRGVDSRYVEDLRRLGQAHGVVLQGLAVDGLHAESHLRLVVDQDQGGVGWVEQFTNRHGAFLLMSILRMGKGLVDLAFSGVVVGLDVTLGASHKRDNYLKSRIIDSKIGTIWIASNACAPSSSRLARTASPQPPGPWTCRARKSANRFRHWKKPSACNCCNAPPAACT
ncbi:hypothetical protein D3C86_1286510 [compost metagenome]